MAEVRKDSGGEILASLSLLHSGSVPSFSEVTPGLSDQSITHCLFQGSARIWKKYLEMPQERVVLKSSSEQSIEYQRMQKSGVVLDGWDDDRVGWQW